jgi:hypothetical protein
LLYLWNPAYAEGGKNLCICGGFFVVNFRMTRDLDLKKSCPLREPDRYFSCSKLDDAKYKKGQKIGKIPIF